MGPYEHNPLALYIEQRTASVAVDADAVRYNKPEGDANT